MTLSRSRSTGSITTSVKALPVGGGAGFCFLSVKSITSQPNPGKLVEQRFLYVVAFVQLDVL